MQSIAVGAIYLDALRQPKYENGNFQLCYGVY